MINWYNLFANSLWIFALALALTTLSFARWQAKREFKSLGEILSRPRWDVTLSSSGALFSLGMAATTTVVWKQVVWAIMMVLFLIQIGIKWKHRD
jgi:hypothetical protein